MADETEPVSEPAGPLPPPTPRPDPYAQFGNPLHDTWGTRTETAPAVPQVRTVSQRKKLSSGARWAIAVAVLLALGVGAYLLRDPIIDAWDSVWDALEDDSGGGSTTVTDATAGFDEAADAETEAFVQWQRDNASELEALTEQTQSAADEMLELAAAGVNTGVVDIADYRGAVVSLRDAIITGADLLGEAPASAIRDDFVSILLVQVAGTDEVLAAIDGDPDADLQQAATELDRATEEAARLCRQYGTSAAALC